MSTPTRTPAHGPSSTPAHAPGPRGRAVPERLRPEDVAAMIDHSLLRPELTDGEVAAGCELARRRGVVSVCVRPADVARARAALDGSSTRVGTVVGFPHGGSTTATKLLETALALDDGAVEVDLVVDLGALRSGRDEVVGTEVERVADLTHARGGLVKVILETAHLDDGQVVRGSRLAERAGADFVKTSTGFAPAGATVHGVRLMAAATSPRTGLKAAGGVRTLDRLLQFVALGVTRFGATATAAILEEAAERAGGGTLSVPAAPLDDTAATGGY
ncbi:deoxyribose-phosphate aldolase [Kineococcus gypseus]|uniref:deoxyribose-phosphate aldolase n=1 Tax=Kineococcus gypseus TaxID=1637102 RepID=UPI003D7DF3AF